MKPYIRKNTSEGGVYLSNVFLSFGKTENGWYIRIELPFSFTDNNFYDLMSNSYKPTKCRKVYCLIYRNKYKFAKLHSANLPIPTTKE